MSSSRIVCVAANPSVDRLVEVERFALGAICRPTRVVAVAGGKGLNVARAAATLGAGVVAAGLLPRSSGAWFVRELSRAGIETTRLVGTEGTARVCMSILDTSTGALTEVYEPGDPISAAEWAALEAIVLQELQRGAAILTLSGSLPPGAPVNGYARLCAAAAETRTLAIVDATGGPLQAALESRPWLVKLNAEEAMTALGGGSDASEDSILEAAREIVRSGATAAVVTRGTDGAVAALDRAAWYVGPAPERGPYPVGCGDAFTAGLAVASASGASIADALSLAAAAAAANAFAPGAGILDHDRLPRLRTAIAVTRAPAPC